MGELLALLKTHGLGAVALTVLVVYIVMDLGDKENLQRDAIKKQHEQSQTWTVFVSQIQGHVQGLRDRADTLERQFGKADSDMERAFATLETRLDTVEKQPELSGLISRLERIEGLFFSGARVSHPATKAP